MLQNIIIRNEGLERVFLAFDPFFFYYINAIIFDAGTHGLKLGISFL